MNLLALSWKNLTNNALSMLLSLVLFALGVGLISLLLLLNKQLDEKFEKNLADIDLVIGAKGSPLQLILCNMYHIDVPTGNISIKSARPFMNPKHPLIKTAIPLSLGDSYKAYRIVGTTHELPDSLYFGELATGALWEKDMEVTIGAAVAENLNIGLGAKFYSSHGLNDDDIHIHDEGQSFKVVGIFKPSGTVLDQLILTTPQSIWKVHDHEDVPPLPLEGEDAGDHEGHDHEGHDHSNDEHDQSHDGTGEAVEEAKPLTEEVDKEITALLVRYTSKTNWRALNLLRTINENTDMQAASPAYEINKLFSMVGAGEQLLRMIAMIIVFVSALSIFISLFKSLRERKNELALMRVMGASRSKLFLLVILEGLLLAFIGYIIGVALSHVGMELLAGVMKDSYRYTFTGWTFMKEEVYLFFGALAIGFIAALIPAVQAANTDISETLGRG